MQRNTSLLFIALGVCVLALSGWAVTRDGSSQSTDDAYVSADSVLVAPKVGGFVEAVLVEDNQSVKRGQLLARIDARDYDVARETARADLASAQAQLASAQAALERQGALVRQARAVVQSDAADLRLAGAERRRYQNLSDQGAGTVQNAQQASARLESAQAHHLERQAALEAAIQQAPLLEAGVHAAQASVQRGQAALARAELDLSHTELRAPVDGMVGRRGLRVGAYVTPGTPLVAVVPLQHAFVIANYQETQMTHVRPGQRVQIRVDVFPGQVLHGHVDSIAPATGVTFAAVAPENATGNFTKVVQRIPVKVLLDHDQALRRQLRVGMSVEADIDLDSGHDSAVGAGA
ncbi:HlyD family secretion protein [Pseudoxanthomonas sp.]|uniref:HlyD family secretion protein n=1 Tax=Pseudoxanthomonas sp. TaxID=1871049 RepID=UPI002618E6BF|nr:HlyD family secretion protein [Pseudoxanthomonas sp.]WDS34975.1 MAG: HlyD family secretion protein [Pseudoxanthomonas sp.]